MTASGGTSAGSTPSRAATSGRRSSIAATQVRLVGPRFDAAAGQAVVVAGRRPRQEPLVAREALAEQPGADDGAVAG